MIRKVLLSMGVRDPRCDPKSYVAQNKTHGYHIDFELCDRSRFDSGLVAHWHLH